MEVGATASVTNDLRLAVDEAVTNIIVHGYRHNAGDIEIAMQVANDTVTIVLRDRAPAFDPTNRALERTTVPLHNRPVGGMGVHLLHTLFDELRYHRTDDGYNELTLVKRLAATVS